MHPPPPRGLADVIEGCKRKMGDVTWPQTNAEFVSFAMRMRRTFEKIVKKYGGTIYTYAWAAIAWAKKKGLAPQTLNRTENRRGAPFWAPAVTWELSTEEGDWHRGWRLLLAGFRATTGKSGTPQGDADSITAAHRLM